MSLRPIDLQASVPKSMEVNKINSYDAQKAGIFNSHFREKIEQESEREQEVIVELTGDEGTTVNKDDKNKGNSKNNNRKNRKRKKSASKKGSSTSMFDVKV